MISSPTLSNVIVVGGSGNIGKLLLNALQSAPDFNVTALARPNSTATFPPEIKVVRAEYTVAELAKVFQGQDAVISAVGATGIAEQHVLVDAAIQAGVKRFLPSEWSANTLPEKVRELVPVFQPKMELLDYLKEKESTGLSWTGLAVGPLFDWVRDAPPQPTAPTPTNTSPQGITQAGFFLTPATHTIEITDSGNELFSTTNESDLANAALEILRKPAATANQYLHIASLTTSQNAIRTSIEKLTGREWNVRNVTSEELTKTGGELIAKGDYSGLVMRGMVAMWGELPGLRHNFEKDEKLANELLGIKHAELDDVMTRVLIDLKLLE
jgi:hypothetical protein